MIDGRVIILKVWRSEAIRVILFLHALVIATVMSHLFPSSVIEGRLFAVGSTVFYLSLPLYWLVPCFLLIELLLRVYNVRYVVDSEGIEAFDGILSLRQSITRIRHEDVRSIETDQNILDRFLDVGNIQIGTAATGSFEVVLQGVAGPSRIQRWLQAERDEVQKRLRGGIAPQNVSKLNSKLDVAQPDYSSDATEAGESKRSDTLVRSTHGSGALKVEAEEGQQPEVPTSGNRLS